MHRYDAKQAPRYFAMALDDIRAIAADESNDGSKDLLAAAFRAWDQASWAWLAWKRKTDFWDLQKSSVQAEKDREVQAALHMPELDPVLAATREALRGWANGHTWEYADGSRTIDRTTFNDCVRALMTAVNRIGASMSAER